MIRTIFAVTTLAGGVSALILMPAPKASAGCHGYSPVITSYNSYPVSYSTPVYQAPVVSYPPVVYNVTPTVTVPVPVLVPAFSFQYLNAVTPAASVAAVAPAPSAAAPLAAPAPPPVPRSATAPPPPPPARRSIPVAPPPEDCCESVRRDIAELKALILLTAAARGTRRAPANFEVPPPLPSRQLSGPDPYGDPYRAPSRRQAPPLPREQYEEPQGGQRGASDPTDLDNRAVAVLSSRCASCHTGASSRGEVTLFNDGGQFAPNVDWTSIFYVTRQKSMPKGASTDPSKALTRDEMALVMAKMQAEN